MARNSIIMICKNIKLDKNYQNVLTYTEQQMYNLCYANKIDYANDFQFIKEEDNSVMVPFTYENCMKSNYMAFQNPRYSNKWFFAFVDSVNYVSDKATRINFTIDVFATWFDYWTPKSCFVIREHVMDDTVGLHTVPEGLETGEYICNNEDYYDGFDTLLYMVQATIDYGDPPAPNTATNFGGVIMAGWALWADTPNHFIDVLELYSGKEDAIYNCYMIPKKFVSNIPENPTSYRWSGQTSPVSDYKTINKPTTLDTYSPVNGKLKTFPYMYLLVSNNNGSSNIYQYERFHEQEYLGHCDFEIKGVPVVGGSFKIIPMDYDSGFAEETGLMAGKFPTLNWSEDSYTNWLTQNAVNLGIGVAGAVATMALTGGVGALVSGGLTIASQMEQKYEHSLVSGTAKGNTNGGDINVCSNCNGFYFYQMSIKKEYAKIIDDFMTRFGYKVNSLKLPNQTGRRYFNYVQIGSSEIIGYPNDKGCPADAMEEINRMYRSGITLWHDHSRIGNYADNTINNT